MEIAALVRSSARRHDVSLRSGDAAARAFAVPAKPDGGGSAVNGGEFLLLALATCFCNDLYREAARLGIALDGIEVEARANFPGVGLAATAIRYRARVDSPAPATAVAELLRRTDAVAEVHNTVRAGVPVDLVEPA